MARAARLIGAAVIALILASETALGRDCAVRAEAEACTSNADCACGANAANGDCQAASADCIVASDDCYWSCPSNDLEVVPRCRDGRCIRARPSRCVGDCDADARVVVPELVTSVGIAMASEPIAACDSVDRDGDGAVIVSELLTAVRGALNGCAGLLGEADNRVLYDAQVGLGSSPPVDALGTLREDGGSTSLALHVLPNEQVFLSTVPPAHDLTMLMGHYLVTDVASGLTGTAEISDEPAATVISGTFGTDFPPHTASTFTMRRSKVLDAQRFAGRYEIAYDRGAGQPGNVAFDIGPDGFALFSDHRFDNGGFTGTITTGECLIAPEGHLYCSALYLDDDGASVNPVRLTGVLSRSSDGTGSGAGRFLIGYDPPFDLYIDAGWSAIRR
jgi:hypothetical protein